nr:reverse transcriptase domain-containing protein [Tanacetum cinerariifolium]
MQKQERMISARITSDASLDSTDQHSKSISPRENIDAEDGQISKDDSRIDNAVVGASHDKVKITKGKENGVNILKSINEGPFQMGILRETLAKGNEVKLLLFPFSLEGQARIWLDKQPPRSILTWEDLVSKFINQFFPPSKTTYLRNEIINFLHISNETFNEAWERFKDLLRQYPHHGFSELHQLDTFYNALNPNDQDALDSAAGSIIESKSKVRYSRSRVTDVRANANAPLPSSSHLNSFDLQQIVASLEDKLKIRMNRFEKSINEMKNSFITPTAPLKANLYNKPSSSSSLPSNTIPNPKGEAKSITPRS